MKLKKDVNRLRESQNKRNTTPSKPNGSQTPEYLIQEFLVKKKYVKTSEAFRAELKANIRSSSENLTNGLIFVFQMFLTFTRHSIMEKEMLFLKAGSP